MEEVELTALLRMLRRQRWVILGVTLGALVAAVLVTLLVVRREYVASSTIVYSQSSMASPAAALMGSIGLPTSIAGTGPSAWFETVLTSRRLAQMMVRKYDLVRVLGADGEQQAVRQTIERIIVTPKPEAQALLLQVRVPGTPKRMIGTPVDIDRAEMAAQIVNDLVAELDKWMKTTEYNTATRQRKYVESQLTRVLDEISGTREGLLAAFRKSGVFAPDQQGQAWLSALATVEQEVAATKAQLAGVDVMREASRSGKPTLQLATQIQPEATRSLVLDELRQQETELQVQLRRETEVNQKTDAHPDVAGLNKALAETRAKIATELEVTRQAQKLQEAALNSRLSQGEARWSELRDRLQGLPSEGLEVEGLRRELESKASLLDMLSKQYLLAAIQEQQLTENFTVLDPAEAPCKAASPSLALAAFVGLVAGALLGLFVGAVREFPRGAAAR
jgi:uncharacterized protein involved in exopolysaccharide biosynthesis